MHSSVTCIIFVKKDIGIGSATKDYHPSNMPGVINRAIYRLVDQRAFELRGGAVVREIYWLATIPLRITDKH